MSPFNILGFKPRYSRWYDHRQLLALVVGLTLLTAWLANKSATRPLDWLIYDTAQYLSRLPPANDLVVIDIDEKSLNVLGRWPWDRSVHAGLLQQLTATGARAIAFDVIFSERNDHNPEGDQAFARAIRDHGQVVLPMYIEQIGLHGQVLEVPPADIFYQAAAAIGHVHAAHDSDGVVRSVFLKEGVGTAFWPHFSLALSELSDQTVGPLPGLRNLTTSPPEAALVIVRDYLNGLPMPGANQGLLHHSYVDVLNGQIDKSTLRGKTIFIGATAAGLGDQLTTPVGTLTGVELNAWIYHALRHHLLIQEVDRTFSWIFQSLLILILLTLIGQLSPKLFLMATLATIAGLIGLSVVMQLFFQRWLAVMPAIIACAAFYPLWSWLRLEKALQFLRSELHELSDRLHHPVEPRHHTLDGLEFLQQLGIVKNWQVLSGDEPPLADQPSTHTIALHQDKKRLRVHFNPTIDTTIDWLNQLKAQPLTERRQKARGTELVARTIDQLNSAKRLVKNSRKLIEQSLAQLQDGVLIADLCGRIKFMNPAFTNLTTTQLAASKNLIDALNPIVLDNGRDWLAVLRELFEQQTAFRDTAMNASTQQKILVQIHLTALESGALDTLVITLTDVSPLHAAEKSRMEALNFLSHDLRSPMVSVLAIIERELGNSDQSATALAHIAALVRKNLHYAESFLQLNRAQSLTAAQLYLCDLHAVLDSAQAHGLALAASKQIQLQTYRSDDDAWVWGDSDLLERAVINLLSNAIKYSPGGSTVILRLWQEQQRLNIAVSDHGIGIPAKDRSRLFTRYQRASNHQNEWGSGLGLNFVAIVAARHNGTITVDSRSPGGSTFTLSLPPAEPEHLPQS